MVLAVVVKLPLINKLAVAVPALEPVTNTLEASMRVLPKLLSNSNPRTCVCDAPMVTLP